MLLDAQDGRLVLKCSPRYTDLSAQIPGLSYKKTPDEWSGPLSWSTALACRGILGDDLQTTPALVRWAEGEKVRLAWVEKFRDGSWILPALRSNLGLYEFQERGATFLAMTESCCLADGMGAGKTVQAITAIDCLSSLQNRPTPLPILIVCTNSMKGKWVEEIHKWSFSNKIKAVTTGPTKATRTKAFKAIESGEAQALVINWQAIRLNSRHAGYGSISLTPEEKRLKELNTLGFQTVIADEAHKAKDPKSMQTRALWALGSTATYRWALTGTPVDGKAEELWSLMHFVSPEEWPSKSKWIDRYAIKGYNIFGGMETYGFNPTTQAELQAFLRPRFLRRTKEEVLSQLPPRVYSTRWVNMETKQSKPYKQMAKDMLAFLGDDALVAPSAMVRDVRLAQLACATPVLGEKIVDGRKIVMVESLEMPSCKVDALLDLIDESGDDALVVGAESKLLLNLCARQLDKAKVPYVMITGDVSSAERTINIEHFQQGGAKVALVSLGAGAEGITLTRARILVFLQRSWSPTVNDQFEARIHRIGQDSNSVEIIDVVTEGTVEIDKFDVVVNKEEVAQQVLNDPAWVRKALSR